MKMNRRDFLKTSFATAAATALPNVIPASALGLDGAVAPSNRIVLGAIGIGNRGSYDLGCFLEEDDVQFVAIADVKAARRQIVKERADAKYGNTNCAMYTYVANPTVTASGATFSSGWHSRGRWCCHRSSCWRTSRRATSIRRPAMRFTSCSFK